MPLDCSEPMIIYETRMDFLKAFPLNPVFAEVGVCDGVNARNILDILKPTQLVLVDTWEGFEKQYQNVLKAVGNNPTVKIHKMLSVEASSLYPNNYFDCVYIDADHSFKCCYEDLNAWYPKVKSGGIIGGHDYTDNEENRRNGFGVVKAVDLFVQENNLEIAFLSNVSRARDYAIRKP